MWIRSSVKTIAEESTVFSSGAYAVQGNAKIKEIFVGFCKTMELSLPWEKKRRLDDDA